MAEKKMRNTYVSEIVDYMQKHSNVEEIRLFLKEYHENDIAEAFELLTPDERKRLLKCVDLEEMSEIFSYLEDVSDYVEELGVEKFADVLEQMDADDAVDVLEGVEESVREELIAHMETEAKEDIQLITSYEEDEIGSQMTTNYIVIPYNSTIKQAMKSLISQAEKNDNINTIYVEDGQGKYYGAIDLKDLIMAREHTKLEDLVAKAYPYVYASEKISTYFDKMRDYDEDSIPVLNKEQEIIGVITANDLVDMLDEELSDDYAKFAGLTEQSDLEETVRDGMKKRLPWLVLLLFLGIIVSSVVGMFENVVSQIGLIICFQSLILDMAGNVGTQSLAVTIRVLVDENVSTIDKIKFIWKELKIGFSNGVLLGSVAFIVIGIYLLLIKKKALYYAFAISGCVGVSLMLAMLISSLAGTLIPMFFHKIHVDPAVASGPLITTVNDLVAVVTYYGIATVILIGMLHITG